MISAPFGRTAMHPMHIDAGEDMRRQIHRLQPELPRNNEADSVAANLAPIRTL